MADQGVPDPRNIDAQGAEPTPRPGRVGETPDKIHAQALKAEEALEQLATMLGKADVDPTAIQGVSAMAKDMRSLVKVMAKGMNAQASAPPRPTMDDAVEGTVQDLRAARGA